MPWRMGKRKKKANTTRPQKPLSFLRKSTKHSFYCFYNNKKI